MRLYSISRSELFYRSHTRSLLSLLMPTSDVRINLLLTALLVTSQIFMRLKSAPKLQNSYKNPMQKKHRVQLRYVEMIYVVFI